MLFDPMHYWYRDKLHPLLFVLLPFAGMFGLCAAFRRWLYRSGLKKIHSFPLPLIVVGNITIGGTGKTPFVIWLANFLKSKGYQPGIVSRGVGGQMHRKPHLIRAQDTASEVGDEALLLRQRTDCPMVICVNRVAAVEMLLQEASCDIVISDDGLQHYRLARDIEVVLLDAKRQFGNQYLLPAGPLRESVQRLKSVDFVISNDDDNGHELTMFLEPTAIIALHGTQTKIALADFPERTIHAIAGIGHPQRFFNTLTQAGFQVIPHVFPDHHLYQPHDLRFGDTLPIIMTEKDAVKCRAFADERCWYVSVAAKMHARFEQALLTKIAIVS